MASINRSSVDTTFLVFYRVDTKSFSRQVKIFLSIRPIYIYLQCFFFVVVDKIQLPLNDEVLLLKKHSCSSPIKIAGGQNRVSNRTSSDGLK